MIALPMRQGCDGCYGEENVAWAMQKFYSSCGEAYQSLEYLLWQRRRTPVLATCLMLSGISGSRCTASGASAVNW